MTNPGDEQALEPGGTDAPSIPPPPPGPMAPTTPTAPTAPAEPTGPTTPTAGPPATGPYVQPAETPPPAVIQPGIDAKGRVRRSRVSGVWIGLVTAAVFLILLVIFIAQNLTKVTIHFLGFSGELSIGLTILISAVFGVIIAAIPGSIRILQLRRALKQNATAARQNRP